MRRFTKILLGAAMLTVLALVGSAGTSTAASVEPVTGVGNPTCAGDLKIEPVVSGTYGVITIEVSGSSFSFSTDGAHLVTAVVVKGGPGFNLYSYPAPGVTSDSGLTAPINPKTNRPYGLSHLCFSAEKKVPDPK